MNTSKVWFAVIVSVGFGVGAAGAASPGSTLADGLVGYWRMEEPAWKGAAGEVRDSSGQGRHGLAFGNAATDPGGIIGRAAKFDGQRAKLIIPDHPSLQFTETTPFSIALWFKGNAGGSEAVELLVKRDYYNHFFMVHLAKTGKVGVALNDGKTGLGVRSSWLYNDGNWHQLIYAYEGANYLKMYLDGVLVGEDYSKVLSGITTKGFELTIGGGLNGCLDGLMDEVAIWKRSLTEAQVKDLWHDGHGRIIKEEGK